MEKIEQPNDEYKRKLNEILSAKPEEITFRGRKKKIGWLHNGTVRKFSSVMMNEENPQKRNAKICATIILNNVWKIRFFYWFLWRYYYYIVDIDDVDILAVLDVSKKKIQQEPFYINTILSTGMVDLMMTMTKKEAKHIQAEHRGEQDTH